MQAIKPILYVALLALVACSDTPTNDISPDATGAADVTTDALVGPSCESNSDCVQPTDPCAQSVCIEAVCVERAQPDGAPCDDGEPCSLESTCQGGSCEAGEAWQDCDDGNPCTADGCQPGAGCTHSALTGPCDDGNPCTSGDICSEGACIGSGSGLCPCQVDTDCADFEDGDVCNGTLMCDAGQCSLNADTIVTCPAPPPTGLGSEPLV